MIETKISYKGKIIFHVHNPALGEHHYIGLTGHAFHRTDYHEDGSQSEYYGIELNNKWNFMMLMGDLKRQEKAFALRDENVSIGNCDIQLLSS